MTVRKVDQPPCVAGSSRPPKADPTRSGLSTVVVEREGERWYVAALRGMVPSVPEGAPRQ